MAESPSHKFGQIIGNLLEAVAKSFLEEYCSKNDLYLDTVGPREVRSGKKVSWIDKYDNSHDLDFVIEKNCDKSKTRSPVAFIESAWRRYTKHSRNKAQEIQGAVLPLAESYSEHSPFLGAILAGVFTDGSLSQLRSHGFSVLYFEYDEIITAFKEVGIDVFFDEDTQADNFVKKIKKYDRLEGAGHKKIINALTSNCRSKIDTFLKELDSSVFRKIEDIRVYNLYGTSMNFSNISEATRVIEEADHSKPVGKFIKYEITIKFNNGNKVEGQFSTNEEALRFLRFLE